MADNFSAETQATIERWRKACELQQEVNKGKIVTYLSAWTFNMVGKMPAIEFIDDESQIAAAQEEHKRWNEDQLNRQESIATRLWNDVTRAMSIYIHREASTTLNQLDSLISRQRLLSDRAEEIITPYCDKVMTLPFNGYRYPTVLNSKNFIIVQQTGKDMKGEDAYERWLPMLQALEAGAWYFVPANDILYVMTIPQAFKVDADRRLHCENGPAFHWMGMKDYYWHNVKIPQWLVDKPEDITPELIEAETNVEVRRVMIERYGFDRYLNYGDVTLIDKDERYGELYVKRPTPVSGNFWGGNDDPYHIIKVKNSTPEPDGTYKYYCLEINPRHYGGEAGKKVQAAVASTFQWQDKAGNWHLGFERWQDYQPSQES